MGSFLSRMKNGKKSVQIRDFNKVIVPKGYKIMKISTYNIGLRNTVNMQSKIDHIVGFIFSEFKNKDIDIISLQGIHDYNSAHALIQEIKAVMEYNDEIFYFAPEFENVNTKQDSFPFEFHPHLQGNEHSHLISWNAKVSSSGQGQKRNSRENKSNAVLKKNKVQNIILSKHPIVSTIYAELDNNTDFDDIIGTHTILGANISVSGNIMSIYNTELSKDIRSAHIVNSDIRYKEIKAVFSVIKQNERNLKNKEFITYNKTDIHMLIGSLNINEVTNGDLNDEFTNFISERHCVDIFRYLTDDKLGYTTTTKERLNYILMLLTDDIYDQSSEYYDKLQELETPQDLFNFIFGRYGIYFLDMYVRDDVNTAGSSNNYPVECVFMINKNKH